MSDGPVISITQRITPEIRAAIAHAMGESPANVSDGECRSFCIGLLAGALQEVCVSHRRESASAPSMPPGGSR